MDSGARRRIAVVLLACYAVITVLAVGVYVVAVVVYSPDGQRTSNLFMAVVMAALYAVYAIPATIAVLRPQAAHASLWIVLVDLALGWTVVGWIVCLVWALRARPPDVDAKVPDMGV